MKSFLDTSVLIPVFLEDHQHHQASFALFLTADKARACCAAHTLAEVYSTFTRLPGRNRLSAEQALLFVRTIRERLTIVHLDADEYYASIEEAAGQGIVGGSIYDALLARCALKAKVERIYTWNLAHFERFGPEVARRLRTP